MPVPDLFEIQNAGFLSSVENDLLGPNEAIESYLDRIKSYPKLSKEQDFALAKRIREGDAEAFRTLVLGNLSLVVSIAKMHENQGVGLRRLVEVGNRGVIKAALRFDESRGFKFLSYAAWWVRQAIFSEIRAPAKEKSGTIQEPVVGKRLSIVFDPVLMTADGVVKLLVGLSDIYRSLGGDALVIQEGYEYSSTEAEVVV